MPSPSENRSPNGKEHPLTRWLPSVIIPLLLSTGSLIWFGGGFENRLDEAEKVTKQLVASSIEERLSNIEAHEMLTAATFRRLIEIDRRVQQLEGYQKHRSDWIERFVRVEQRQDDAYSMLHDLKVMTERIGQLSERMQRIEARNDALIERVYHRNP